MDHPRRQQHRNRVAQHRRPSQPSPVGHEDPRRQAHQVGEDRQRDQLADQGQLPLGLRHARHGDEIQGRQECADHQQGPAGRFQLPAMMGVEPDAENGRRNRDEDEELEIGDPFQGFPQADHQRDRRADQQQTADQLAPADIALFHEGRQHLGPGPRRRLRFRGGRSCAAWPQGHEVRRADQGLMSPEPDSAQPEPLRREARLAPWPLEHDVR